MKLKRMKINKNFRKTYFNARIRIKRSRLKWLRDNKKHYGFKTMARYLDEIIDNHIKDKKKLP